MAGDFTLHIVSRNLFTFKSFHSAMPFPQRLDIPNPDHPPELKMASSAHLAISPYRDEQQLLDTSALPRTVHLLVRSLAILEPVHGYQIVRCTLAFNWQDIVDRLRALIIDADMTWTEMRLYVVVFRSRHPPTMDGHGLWALDEAAFTEAVQNGGLFKYFCGDPDSEGNNLSMCMLTLRPQMLVDHQH